MLLLCSVLIRAHLEYYMQLWGPLYKEGMLLLERAQSMAMKIRGAEEIFYEDRLRELGLFCLQKRRPEEGLTVAFQKGAYKKN